MSIPISFDDALAEGLLNPSPEPFKPSLHYSAAGDCLEFIAKDVPFKGERIDGMVTVYVAEDTDDVVGVLLKGASNLIRFSPNIQIILDDQQNLKLHNLLILYSGRIKPIQEKPLILYYQRLLEVAADSELALNVCLMEPAALG